MPKTPKEKIIEALKDFALTFALLENDGTYWGHDTNLGTCEEEFNLATNQLLEFLSQEKQKWIEGIKLWERIYGKTISTRMGEGKSRIEAIIATELDRFYCDGYNQAVADLEKLKQTIKNK